MEYKFDIDIQEIEKIDNGDLEYSKLTLKFTGDDVNMILLNTLRRAVMGNIPTYGFATECIKIDKNTSVFNNDQMRVRLMQLPVIGIPLDLAYLDDKYWFDVNYASKERPIHKLERRIELCINTHNTETTIKNVTTNDIRFLIDNEDTPALYNKKYPIVLIQLKPNEEFVCNMKAVLGVGERNVIWNGASNSYLKTDKDEKMLVIESRGQFDEYELLLKAAMYIQEKMTYVSDKIRDTYLKNKIKEKTTSVELTLDNESYTIGGILTYVLQNMDVVKSAGVGRKNELVNQITICIEYVENIEDSIEPIFESINVVNAMMKHICDVVNKIGGKYIKSFSDKTEKQKKKAK